MRATRQLPFPAAAGLWAALGLAAALYGNWMGFGGPGLAIALGAFLVLLAGQVLFASAGLADRAHYWLSQRGAILLAPSLLLLAVYLSYLTATQHFTLWRLGGAAAYILLPSLLTLRARSKPAGAWEDFAALLAIWLPIEFRWLPELWPYPNPRLGYVLAMLLGINVAVAAFLLVRRLEGVGYSVAWGRGWVCAVVLNFLIFAALAIPLGMAIGFIEFAPALARLKTLPITVLGILMLTAWPEELLFRGLLQNLLARAVGNPVVGWLAASVVFGLAHINNLGFPNWRYVLLATIAGVFYGRAWMKTGSIFASALVHTLVNTTWHLFFRTL
jgi:hypothetical protein